MARRKYNTRKAFDKTELFNFIDKFEIEKVGSILVTKYDGRVIKSVEVSNKYEIFDFKKYMKDKIELISENFNINEYATYFAGGIQEVRLFSDNVDISGDIYEKCFYFLNSTDKTRVLNLNLGLYNKEKNFYSAFSKSEFSLRKRHLIGVTDAANKVSSKFSENTFNVEIEMIKSLVGQSVKLSSIQDILIKGDNGEVTIGGHFRFDAFKKAIEDKASNNQKTILRTKSVDLANKYLTNEAERYDFYLDAYDTFVIYTTLFTNHDSYVVAKETDRILNITQQMVRNSKLDELFA